MVEFALEVFRSVSIRIDFLAGLLIVGQLHNVVEVTGLFVAADVEDIDLAFVCAGNRFEFLNAFELALKGPVVRKVRAIDKFDGAICAHEVSGQPDPTVAAATDRPQQFVIRNGREAARCAGDASMFGGCAGGGETEMGRGSSLWLAAVHTQREGSRKTLQG